MSCLSSKERIREINVPESQEKISLEWEAMIFREVERNSMVSSEDRSVFLYWFAGYILLFSDLK